MQAVRRINENGHPAFEGSPSEVIYVACYPDPSLGKDIVLWDDILAAFKAEVVHVRSGAFVLPFLKGPDFKNLDPLRIAAVLGTTLDVAVRNHSGEQELSMKSLQEALPTTLQEPSSVKITTTAATMRRNPAGGLVEAAMENYTHMENPATAPRLRGPQAIQDGPASLAENEYPNNGQLGEQSKETTAPEDRSSAVVQKFVETELKARLGDMIAQFALGEMYDHGQGTVQSASQAFEWYKKAADQGYVVAQYTIGERYQKGQGVTQDYRQAMDWYLKAAKQGYAAAQNEAGFMFEQGQGLGGKAHADYFNAFSWYEDAAAQGYAAAQYNIGNMYYSGQGLMKNHSAAMDMYLKAGSQGHVSASTCIGKMYFIGQGVTQDYSKAAEWYLKAATQGDNEAQNSLAVLYEAGLGVPADKTKAIE
ncbi:hypothetical protein BGZ95_006845, partial [Linnemannia exigua]